MTSSRLGPGSTDLWRMLKGARVYDLAQPLEDGLPAAPSQPGFRMALMRRHGDMDRPDGVSSAFEMIVTHTHAGTHMDALAHIAHGGKLHGGVDAYEAQKGGRFRELGIDQVKPIVCRGVLLDIAGLHGVPSLAPGVGITAEDLRRAAERAGVEVQKGDAVLVRSGWAAHWRKPATYLGRDTGAPGVDETGANLIAEWGARVTGHDSMGYEQSKPDVRLVPVHRILLFERGIHIIENLNMDELAGDGIYEFLFVATPLKIVGATGSPVRPIAIAVRERDERDRGDR